MDVRIRRQPSGEIEEDVFDVRWLDAQNRFARDGTLKIDDIDGDKQDDYRFYQRVEIEARTDFNDTFERSFSGIVVESHDRDQQGADILEADIYSYDHLLRTDQIDIDLTEMGIAEGLEAIIDEVGAVTWNADNVEVQDEQTLDRVFVGEKIDSAIGELASLSADEIYGVNNDLEFFFTPPEPTNSGEEIDNSDWVEYDFPEKDKESVNEVTVYYGPEGEGGSVTVDDAPDKQNRQDKLGSNTAPINYVERTFEEITDPQTAESKAKEIRDRFSRLLIGNVTTWRPLLDVDTGDTIDITIDPINVDDEFRIADIERRWADGVSDLTVVANVGNDEELLAELTDRVDRIQASRSERDVPEDRIVDTNIAAAIEPLVTLGGTTATDVRLTNTGRNLIRDGWAGEGNLDIADIAVGDDGSNLSRTNESLESETNRVSASESLIDTTSARYEASVGDSTTREVGLFTSSGDLVVRAVYDSGGSEVMAQLTVGDSVENELGVLTDTAQEAVRDIIADNAPVLPEQYAFGGSDTDPTESDTSLGNELAVQDLDEILIQSASTQSEWEGLTESFSDDTPLSISNGSLVTEQIAFGLEGENDTSFSGNATPTGDTDVSYSDGSALQNIGSDGTITWAGFTTPEYRIPSGDVGIAFRLESNGNAGAGTITFYLNGDEIGSVAPEASLPLDWYQAANDLGGGYTGEDLQAGETLSLEAEYSDSRTDVWIDYIVIYDTRYMPVAYSNWDNTVHQDNGYLDDPPLYPTQEIDFETAATRRDVTEANFTLTATDVSGDFWVELANDGTTYNRVNNSQTGSVSFSGPETGVDTRVQLDAYGSGQSATPRNNYLGQEISSWELYANPDAITPSGIGISEARAVFNSGGPLDGQTLREAGLLGPSSELLTRSIFAPVEVTSDMTVISSELTRFTQDG